MKVTKDPYNRNLVSSRTVALTPYEIYLQQVRAVSDNIRFTQQGLDYYPLQFGGLKGQRQAIIGKAVVDIIDFQSKGNAE